jgi:hypothetical protein
MNSSSSNVDGIGRRRGAAATTKNVSTSILVAIGTFILMSTLWFILSMNLSSMKDNNATAHEKDAPPVATGSIRNSQNMLLRNGSSNLNKYAKEVEDFPSEIMRGELHLIEIDTSGMRITKDGYSGAGAFFCKLDWDAYKNDPPSLPMFRFLVSKSGCDKRRNQVVVDLAMIADTTKAYDKSLKLKNRSDVRSMKPTGFVFHESRVG